MPTFAVDASSAGKSNRSGVEWYAFHLIEAMKNQALADGEHLVFYTPETLRWPLPFGWMKGRVTWEMLRRRADALLVPAQGIPLAGKVAAVIHDVGFLRVPGVYAPADRRRQQAEAKRVVRRAKKILAVSEFTKREVMDLYKVPGERIVVAPNAVNADVYRPVDAAAAEAAMQKHRLGRNFFLYVGRLDAKKNIKTLIRSFELFKSARGTGDPFELVLVGSQGYGFSEIKTYLDHSGHRADIRLLGYVEDRDVAALMGAATAFAFPSWYEGFGVPPLEAAACGAPLIVSDIGAHREVLGDAALFVSPKEPESWARAMQQMVLDPGLRESLRAKGFARAAAYSWDATAKVALETLRGML